jgi:tetratricopeptide (TPR) repeat protein
MKPAMENRLSHNSTDLKDLLEKAVGFVNAGKLDAAEAIYRQLVKLFPDASDLHHTLGLVCFEKKDIAAALYHIGRALELDPSNAVAYRSLGDALSLNGQLSLSFRAYEQACNLNPLDVNARINLGNALCKARHFDSAMAAFEEVLSLDHNHHIALNNLGKVNHDLGRLEQALRCYDRCIEIHPDYAEAHFNRAALLLDSGRFESGWKEYEWRFKYSAAHRVYPHRLSSPRWQGQDFHGRRLLVHCEQGMGDVLQFCRYLPMVKQKGGTVILEVHKPLARLFNNLPLADEVVSFDPKQLPSTGHDLHIPLLSLPLVFSDKLTSIPDAFPYLHIDLTMGRSMKDTVMEGRINIGLVWASSALNPHRNLPIEKCGAWFQNPRLHFVSLQVGKEEERLKILPQGLASIARLGGELDDFFDTASAMADLDLVICVDTAAAHLAGALGKPLWVLLPYDADWRWPRSGAKCVWYPQAKVFRQTRMDDWESVISEVTIALEMLS